MRKDPVVPAHGEQGLLAAGEAARLTCLAPLCRLEPLGGVALDHRAGSHHVELSEAHPGDLPAQRPVGDHGRQPPLPELAVAVEHQGADVAGRAQQAVEPPSLGPGGTDGDPGASVQAVFHGHPWYGRPPTESNLCLPLRKEFFRQFLASGSADNSANVRCHGTGEPLAACAGSAQMRPGWPDPPHPLLDSWPAPTGRPTSQGGSAACRFASLGGRSSPWSPQLAGGPASCRRVPCKP